MSTQATRRRITLSWGALIFMIAVPLALSAISPLLAYRDPIYIIAGLAGIASMCILLIQPMLAAGYLPGLALRTGRQIHRWMGIFLIFGIIVHIGGLWITSPPDVIDVLTFTSPTPFSIWGVLAMWGVFGAGVLANFRRKLRPITWRRLHIALAIGIVGGTILHAWLIEGTMEQMSKAALSLAIMVATTAAILGKRR